jgi:hypothetical protein
MELQSYRNNWGWLTVTLEECDNAELIANGVDFTVWDLATGSPSYHQNRWQAELHAQLLAEYYAGYAIEHTCQENPAILHRNGFVTQGHFAGLPVAFMDGVAGVWLFERFTAI